LHRGDWRGSRYGGGPKRHIRLTRKLGRQVVKRLRARDGGELLLLARKIARFIADNEH
jgi:hypothetical protein